MCICFMVQSVVGCSCIGAGYRAREGNDNLGAAVASWREITKGSGCLGTANKSASTNSCSGCEQAVVTFHWPEAEQDRSPRCARLVGVAPRCAIWDYGFESLLSRSVVSAFFCKSSCQTVACKVPSLSLSALLIDSPESSRQSFLAHGVQFCAFFQRPVFSSCDRFLRLKKTNVRVSPVTVAERAQPNPCRY